VAKNDKIKVLKNNKENDIQDITDIELLIVSNSKEEIVEYDRQRIVDSLMKETNMARSTAQVIANSVDKTVAEHGDGVVSTSFIRGLVQMELRARGFTKKLEEYDNVAIPFYNIEQMIDPPKVNGLPSDKSSFGINNHIASYALKDFTLKRVFSHEIRDAHLSGRIHLHGLAYPNCFYQGIVNIEHVKKSDTSLLETGLKITPPVDIHSLMEQVLDFVFDFQNHFSGVIGLVHLNVFMAPFMINIENDDMAEITKQFLLRICKSAALRNGQNNTLELGLDIDVPDFLLDSPALGPNGKYMAIVEFEDDSIERVALFDKPMRGNKWQSRYQKTLQKDFDKKIKNIRLATYSDFKCETAKIFSSVLVHCGALDINRITMAPIKLSVSIDSQDVFDSTLWDVVLESMLNGANINILFNRPSNRTLFKQPCGISMNLEANGNKAQITNDPTTLKQYILHHITVNLPRCSYDIDNQKVTKQAIMGKIGNLLKVVALAHSQKIKYLNSINNGLFFDSFYDNDEAKFFDINNPICSVGAIGLSELLDVIIDLDDTVDRSELALEIIAHMYMELKKLSEETGINMILDESVFESINMRFCRIDFKQYDKARNYINGDKRTSKIYYTDSIHISSSDNISPPEKVALESPKHRIIGGRTDVTVFMGASNIECLNRFLQFVWGETDCFSLCLPINLYVYNGTDGLSLSTTMGENEPQDVLAYNGYTYSLISFWNDAKLGEFSDRVVWTIDSNDSGDLIFIKEKQNAWTNS